MRTSPNIWCRVKLNELFKWTPMSFQFEITVQTSKRYFVWFRATSYIKLITRARKYWHRSWYKSSESLAFLPQSRTFSRLCELYHNTLRRETFQIKRECSWVQEHLVERQRSALWSCPQQMLVKNMIYYFRTCRNKAPKACTKWKHKSIKRLHIYSIFFCKNHDWASSEIHPRFQACRHF